jgi:hypothetical protein
MPRQQLDLTTPIVLEGRATAYLESLFFELFAAIETAPVTVSITSAVATVDLTKGSQFNITANDDFEIVIIGVENRVCNWNVISIDNPAGAYDLTGIASAGVTVNKLAGSTIAIIGGDAFSFPFNVVSDERIDFEPAEMVPV